MTGASIPTGEWLGGTVVALLLQGGAVLALGRERSAAPPLAAARPEPVAVEIVPILDEERLPTLKYGSKKPATLPDMWQKPKQIPRKEAAPKTVAPMPSKVGQPTTKAAPDLPATKPVGPEPSSEPAEDAVKKADETIPTLDAGPPPATTSSGVADGVPSGTEADPLKAQQVSLYRAQLRAWFASRFAIRGKVPFAKLKTLMATATVLVDASRRVAGYSVKGSGDPVFDAEVDKTLAAAKASGAELPAPPDKYPDVLGSSLTLSFQCTVASQCE